VGGRGMGGGGEGEGTTRRQELTNDSISSALAPAAAANAWVAFLGDGSHPADAASSFVEAALAVLAVLATSVWRCWFVSSASSWAIFSALLRWSCVGGPEQRRGTRE